MDSDLEGVLDLVKSDKVMVRRIQEHVAEGRTAHQAADLAMRGELSKAETDRLGGAGGKVSKALDVLHGRSGGELLEKGDALRLVHAEATPKRFKVGSVTYHDVGPMEAGPVEDPRRFGRSPLE